MYVLYKTTNKVNGKFYIGIHKTIDADDSYLGSGKNLKRAVAKYGKDAFDKEIIATYSCLEDARNAERAIVTESFVQDCNTYNIAIGGGLGGENLNGFTFRQHNHSKHSKNKISQARLGRSFLTEAGINAIIASNRENEERKRKISLTLSGKKKPLDHKEKIAASIRELNRVQSNPNKGKKKAFGYMLTLRQAGRSAQHV